MKVLAFNSSPTMHKGGTSLILTPFLQGMEQAGADIELFYLRKLKIKPCLGCFKCWFETPGQCIQKDDMQMLYPKLKVADVIVFATPVYVDGMTGTMKTLIERCIPLVHPFFEIREGHCRHPLRDAVKRPKIVLVSVCGFHELDNFDPLLSHMKAICKNLGSEFAGALLRPYAAALPHMQKMGLPAEEIYEAAREAGRQLVRDGAIKPQTLTAVSRELVPKEVYVQTINQVFQRALAALESKKSK